MSSPSTGSDSENYFSRLAASTRASLVPLLRPASHPSSGLAAAKLLHHSSLLMAIGAVAVVALMFGFDVREINMMPPRGAPGLWPVRLVTDFGKAENVLWVLAGLLIIVTLAAPRAQGTTRSRLLRFGAQLQFLFLAVLVPILAGEIIKWIVGRGRPFVGGEANAFNFVHFAGTKAAYASFPSAHAITAAALAFAVSAVWPRAFYPMIVYALLIVASRLVLLAHHPSDVTAGAVIGIVGAMAVRHWLAARSLGFGIGGDGTITPPI